MADKASHQSILLRSNAYHLCMHERVYLCSKTFKDLLPSQFRDMGETPLQKLKRLSACSPPRPRPLPAKPTIKTQNPSFGQSVSFFEKQTTPFYFRNPMRLCDRFDFRKHDCCLCLSVLYVSCVFLVDIDMCLAPDTKQDTTRRATRRAEKATRRALNVTMSCFDGPPKHEVQEAV